VPRATGFPGGRLLKQSTVSGSRLVKSRGGRCSPSTLAINDITGQPSSSEGFSGQAEEVLTKNLHSVGDTHVGLVVGKREAGKADEILMFGYDLTGQRRRSPASQTPDKTDLHPLTASRRYILLSNVFICTAGLTQSLQKQAKAISRCRRFHAPTDILPIYSLW
jgi:hypothetical protein